MSYGECGHFSLSSGKAYDQFLPVSNKMTDYKKEQVYSNMRKEGFDNGFKEIYAVILAFGMATYLSGKIKHFIQKYKINAQLN